MERVGQVQSGYCTSCSITELCKAPSTGNALDHFQSTTNHVQVTGPMPTESFGAKSFHLTMIIMTNRYVRTYLMQTRADAPTNSHGFMSCTDKNAKDILKRVHCDCMPEFIYFQSGLKQLWINLTTSSPYIIEPNGVTEKMSRSLMDKACYFMTHVGLPCHYWSAAVQKRSFIEKRVISPASDMKSSLKYCSESR